MFDRNIALLSAILIAIIGVSHSQLDAKNVIVAFNNAAQDDVRSAGVQNQLSAKVYALVHLAQYESIAAAPSNASDAVKSARAAYAAHFVLDNLFPWRYQRHDAVLAQYLGGLSNDERKAANDSSSSIASSLLSSRVSDGFNQYVNFTASPANGPAGAYQFTPNQTSSLYPQLASTKTFVINPANFPLPPPNNVTSDAYKKDLEEVFTIGVKNSTTRTSYQNDTAYFWADGNLTSAIGGHFNQIIPKVLPSNTKLADVAKVYAQANVAAFDANVAGWAGKYKWLFWRPITAIRQGDGTNTAFTKADWSPELATPPHPEYASGHQYTVAAIARVVAKFLGNDTVPFTIGTEYPNLQPRNFTSLQAAVDDVGNSRVYGGVHFRKSIDEGNALGAKVADEVIKNWNTTTFLTTTAKSATSYATKAVSTLILPVLFVFAMAL